MIIGNFIGNYGNNSSTLLESATIQSGTPSVLDLVFGQAVNISTTSWTIISSSGVSISSVLSGDGTRTPKFQLSRTVYSGETLHIFYSGGGDTEFTSGTALGATYIEVTNNSTSVARSPEQMVSAGVFANTDYIYWDAERGVTVDGSNGVTAVDDQGGGNRDLAGVASFLPTLITDANGKKWFRFNESSMTAVLTNFSTIVNDYSMFIVMKYGGVVSAAEIGNIWFNASGNRFIVSSPVSAGVSPTRHGVTLPASLFPGSGPIPNRVHHLHYDWTGTEARAYVNGELDAAPVAYTQMTYGPASVRIGSAGTSSTNNFKGDIAKIFFIKGTLSDAIKAELRSYFDGIYSESLYDRFAFLANDNSDADITSSVIQEVTGTFDYAMTGSFCIRRSNGKYYRTMLLGASHNNNPTQMTVLQTSEDKGTTQSEFIPLTTGYGFHPNPYNPYTSASSVLIGTGAKTFTVAAGLTIADASRLTIAKSDDLGESMHGTVTSYNEGTGELVMNIDLVSGSGTYASWKLWPVEVDSATPDLNSVGGISIISTGRMFIGYNKARSSPSYTTRLLYSDDDGVTIQAITGAGDGGLLTTDYPDPGQLTGKDAVMESNGDLYKAFYGRTLGTGDREVVVYKSDDGLEGQTWTKLATPQAIESHDYEEPELLDLGEGMFLILMRSDPQNTSRSRFSWDYGETWSDVRQDAFPSVGYNGAVVTPNGGIIAFGRYASTQATPGDTMLNYSNRYGQSGSWVSKKINADDYYALYGQWAWDYDLNIPVGVYWEEKNASANFTGPTRIVFVKAQEV